MLFTVAPNTPISNRGHEVIQDLIDLDAPVMGVKVDCAGGSPTDYRGIASDVVDYGWLTAIAAVVALPGSSSLRRSLWPRCRAWALRVDRTLINHIRSILQTGCLRVGAGAQ